MGKAEISKLSNTYKDASADRAQIEKYDHAMIENQVLPYGCIMAGDWEHNASWEIKVRKKREAKAKHEADALLAKKWPVRWSVGPKFIEHKLRIGRINFALNDVTPVGFYLLWYALHRNANENL